MPAWDESHSIQTRVTKVIDLEHLSRQTLGDHSLEAELLHLFDLQAALILNQLGAIPSENTPQRDTHLVHCLKGSALAIGAKNVAAIAEKIENGLHKRRKINKVNLRDLKNAVELARQAVALLLAA